MSALSATPDLTPEERTALQRTVEQTRRSSLTLIALMGTFFVPLLATFAFVGLYPPFWNPRLAASAAGIAGLVLTLFVLIVLMALRPSKRLAADLQAGVAEDHEGEVATCDRRANVVKVSLADAPRQVWKLQAPVVGQDDREGLSVGQRVRMRLLPRSGRLVSLQRL